MVGVPEFFASFLEDTSKDGLFIPKPVPFEEIKNYSDKLTSLTALWNYNSYHFNVRGEAIINGGRRIQLSIFKNPNTRIICKRRHQLDIGMNDGKPVDKRLLYVLGLECYAATVRQVAVLLISEDGKEWSWRDFV